MLIVFKLIIVLLFLCEKFGSKITQSLSVSWRFSSSSFLIKFSPYSKFLLFALVIKCNISYTDIESPYVCIYTNLLEVYHKIKFSSLTIHDLCLLGLPGFLRSYN